MPVFVEISACLARGWSVIPLIGGPEISCGKRPTIRWQTYTCRLPSPAEAQRWFGEKSQPAYGVVCGSVSGLVVLDLDDPALAQRFADAFPHLLDTLVVASGQRHTPHIYWCVDYPVRTRAFPGGDLKAEGGYVVGPGSQIGGHTWQIVNDKSVRTILPDELDAVLKFLLPPSQPQPVMQSNAPVRDYPALYQYYVERFQSRNQALFVTACHMRDGGCGQSQAVDRLARVYAAQPSLRDGRSEGYPQRYAEALRTIQSAYSRPARLRPQQEDSGEAVSRVPNSVREALLKRQDGVAIARLIEAVHIKGAGPVITEPMLCRLLKGIISRETIRKALAAAFDSGQLIFCPPDNPPALAEIPVGMSEQKNAFLLAGQKQTRQYLIPDTAVLCSGLKVQPSGSDPITLEHVSSSRNYRQALHKALVARRPGVYAQAFLGTRLGVSSRSVRRYNRETGVKAQPTYHETPLFWTTLDQVPLASDIQRFGIQVGGRFLLDDTGKRWPLKREIAAQLLGQGRHVSIMRQGCSHYSVGDMLGQPAVLTSDGAIYAPAKCGVSVENNVYVIGERQDIPPGWMPQPLQDSPNFAREGVSAPKTVQKRVIEPKRHFRRPLPDFGAEHTACRIYHAVDEITLPNARRLVDTYGSQPVEAALRKFNWLKSQSKVTHPAGLLVTLARVSWRASQRQAVPVPRFRAEPARKPRATGYVHPKHDPLWKSAAYRDWRAEFFGLDDPLANVTLEEIVF